jgi:hypothetical protein
VAVLSIPPRSAHTVTRRIGDEFLVLNESTGHALCLEGPSATIWAAAGTTADVDPTALAELTERGLLDVPGLTRRSMLKRTGAVAGGVGIASILLPMASAAASPVTRSITLTPSTGFVGSTVSVSRRRLPRQLDHRDHVRWRHDDHHAGRADDRHQRRLHERAVHGPGCRGG